MVVVSNNPKLTESQIHSFSYSLSRIIKDFYLNPENLRRYEEWKLRKGVNNGTN